MRRLYVLLPTEESCRAVVADLESMGISESQLHLIAGLTHDLRAFPSASIWQRTELAPGIGRGVALGGMAGLLGGLLVNAAPPTGMELGGGALLALTAAGAAFGSLVTALLGIQEHNHKLDAFQRALSAGQLLLMVDVSGNRENEIRAAILLHHPEAEIGSVKAARR